MQLSTFALAATLIQLVSAQTPQGFVPAVSQNLIVTYGNTTISPPGDLIPRPNVASPPTISSKVFSTTGKAIIFLIDSDVPQNGTRVPLLHWFVPGVTGVTGSSNITALTIPTTGPGAPYLQPSPPPGDAPHRYTFLLFSQPANFTVPAAFASINPPATQNNRIGFNITAFIAAAKLSPPIAANYMLVQNTSAPASSTSYPPASVTLTTTTTSGGSSTTTRTVASTVTSSTTAASTALASTSRSSTATSSGSTASTTSNAAPSVGGGSGLALFVAVVFLFGLV